MAFGNASFKLTTGSLGLMPNRWSSKAFEPFSLASGVSHGNHRNANVGFWIAVQRLILQLFKLDEFQLVHQRLAFLFGRIWKFGNFSCAKVRWSPENSVQKPAGNFLGEGGPPSDSHDSQTVRSRGAFHSEYLRRCYIVFRCFGVFNFSTYQWVSITKLKQGTTNAKVTEGWNWPFIGICWIPQNKNILEQLELSPARRITIDVEESQKIGRNSNSQLEKVHQNGKMHFFWKDI